MLQVDDLVLASASLGKTAFRQIAHASGCRVQGKAVLPDRRHPFGQFPLLDIQPTPERRPRRCSILIKRDPSIAAEVPLRGEHPPLSVSRKDHSLLEEQASIPARLASVDDGISFARTFIELFAR
jgi:hypothetical protein